MAMSIKNAVTTLDSIDASDCERAHYEADRVLLAVVPDEVRQAYLRLSGSLAYEPYPDVDVPRTDGRARWWVHA